MCDQGGDILEARTYPAYRGITVDVCGGSAEGYIVDAGASNLENFLYSEVSPESTKIILEVIRSGVQKVAVMKSLYVEEERRGEGLGNSLVDHFLRGVKDAQAIILLADSQESQAEGFDLQRFYEGFDFEPVVDGSAGKLMVYPGELAQLIRESLVPQVDRMIPSP